MHMLIQLVVTPVWNKLEELRIRRKMAREHFNNSVDQEAWSAYLKIEPRFKNANRKLGVN